MQLSIKLTLLSLAVTSTAIDIMFYTLSYCGGSRIGCERWNPDSCCTSPFGVRFPSVYFDYIPSSWNLETRGHQGDGCGARVSRVRAQGPAGICHSEDGYTGGGYGFINRKRSAEEKAIAAENCAPADTLILENGRKFNISGLQKTQFLEIFDQLNNQTGSGIAPHLLKELVEVK